MEPTDTSTLNTSATALRVLAGQLKARNHPSEHTAAAALEGMANDMDAEAAAAAPKPAPTPAAVPTQSNPKFVTKTHIPPSVLPPKKNEG